MERKNELKYIMLIFLAICFLATGGIFVRLSLLPPMHTAFYRVLLSIPLLYPFARNDLKTISKKDVLNILLAGVFFGIDLAVWNVSFGYTSVANATLLANLVSFTVVPVSYFLFKEKIPSKFLLSIGITVAGVAILLKGKIVPSQSSLFGDFLAFFASFFYASFLLMVYRARDRVNAMTIIFICSFSTAVTIFSIMCFREGFIIPKTFNELYPLLGTALCSQIIGQGLMSFCLGKVKASLSSVLVLTQPVIAALYSFILFRESLTAIELLGIFITSIGVYYAKKTT